MGKITYNPELSIKEIRRQCHVSEAAVRKYISDNFIDREYDSELIKYRRVQQYFNDHPGPKNFTAASKALCDKYGEGYSRNTVKKYANPENAPSPRKNKFTHSMIDPSLTKAMFASVSGEDRLILATILRLYLRDDRFDCDLTFSKGEFYRYGVQYPRLCFDFFPEQPSDLVAAPEVKHLREGYNLRDNSLSSIVIDLPQAINENCENSIEAFHSISHLALSYYDMLKLAYSKLRYKTETHPGGLLIVKVGDITWNGKTLWMPNIVTELATGNMTRLSSIVYNELKTEAERRGSTVEKEFPLFDMELIDKYVHTFEPENTADRVPGHSIKAHDYFLVFMKGENRTKYDTFYYGSDSENPKDSFLGPQDEIGAKTASRLSLVKEKNSKAIRVPRKNIFNHIDYSTEVSYKMRELISNELISSGLSKQHIPFQACQNGEIFMNFVNKLVFDGLLENIHDGTIKRKALTKRNVDNIIANVLKKCGIIYIQQSVITKNGEDACYRYIIDTDAVKFDLYD